MKKNCKIVWQTTRKCGANIETFVTIYILCANVLETRHNVFKDIRSRYKYWVVFPECKTGFCAAILWDECWSIGVDGVWKSHKMESASDAERALSSKVLKRFIDGSRKLTLSLFQNCLNILAIQDLNHNNNTLLDFKYKYNILKPSILKDLNIFVYETQYTIEIKFHYIYSKLWTFQHDIIQPKCWMVTHDSISNSYLIWEFGNKTIRYSRIPYWKLSFLSTWSCFYYFVLWKYIGIHKIQYVCNITGEMIWV